MYFHYVGVRIRGGGGGSKHDSTVVNTVVDENMLITFLIVSLFRIVRIRYYKWNVFGLL